MTTTTTLPPVTFLDPQPHPGDGDRVWFAPARSSTDLYAVTRATCSCPAGTYHPDRICAHRAVLLDLLGDSDLICPSCGHLHDHEFIVCERCAADSSYP